MNRNVLRVVPLLTGALALGQVPSSPDFFESRIRPVLANNCFSCHTNTQMGGLRVDSLEGLKKGGKRGAALTPGDPEKSLLIQAVRHSDPDLKMPMGTKLAANQIADLVEWVKAGAVWPAPAIPAAASKAKNGELVIAPEVRNFWSFQPLKTPAAPAVKATP